MNNQEPQHSLILLVDDERTMLNSYRISLNAFGITDIIIPKQIKLTGTRFANLPPI